MATQSPTIKLTAKQGDFILAYLETGNASEAYRQAYNAENMKPETISRKAHELMGNGKITAQIEALRAPVVEAAQCTLEQHFTQLAKLRDGAEERGEFTAAIKAEELRGKAAGHYSGKGDFGANADGFMGVVVLPEQSKSVEAWAEEVKAEKQARKST